MNKGPGPECQPDRGSGEGAGGFGGWLRRHRLAVGAALLAVLILIAVVVTVVWKGLTLQDLRDRREAFTAYIHAHPVLSVEIYMAAYFALLCFSLPGALIMSFAGGYLFGVWEGTAAAVTALMLAGLVMYGVARWIMGDGLREKLLGKGGLSEGLQKGVEDNAFLSLLSLRLIPGLPFGLVNIAAAGVRIPVTTYAAATFAGVVPSTMIYVSTGHALVSALARNGAPKLSSIITPQVYLPLIGLCLLSAAPLAWKAWRARRERLAGSHEPA